MINSAKTVQPARKVRASTSLLLKIFPAVVALLWGQLALSQIPSNLTQEQAAALLQGDQSQVQSQIQDNTGVTPRDVNASAAVDGIEANAQLVQGPESLTEEVADATTPEPLRQFGYELFAGAPTTFAPATNIPVPLNYVIGPNDTVIIQLYGQRNVRYELVVTREGVLQFPEIGPLNVAGLTFEQAQALLQTTVSTSLIGQQASITMGALRSIQIFVLGEAFRPGSYTVSSLSTMTNAIFSSGGITRVGSLRDIRLMRQGTLITTLDLYDLLLRGDTSGDVRLQPNDVIFIPPIGRTLGIAGEVKRPAIFELKDEQTLQDVLPLSGGYLPTAFPLASRIERINALGERTLVDVNLNVPANLSSSVSDGDVLQVYSILDQIEGVVLLEGHVNRPGGFAWRDGMRVTDVLANIGDMLPNPDLDFALIAREQQPSRRIEVVYVNLRQALSNPGSNFDLLFQPRDRLIVFGARQTRQAQLTGLVNTLREQATFDAPATVVSVQGNVLYPSDYPLTTNMQVNDLIQFAGGLQENSELDFLMLERDIDNQGRLQVEPLSLNASSLQTNTPVALRSGDSLYVFDTLESRQALLAPAIGRLRQQASSVEQSRVVSINGNVRYPGEYPLVEGLTLQNLIQFAGGLTESAESRQAEISRFSIDTQDGRELEHIEISLLSAGPAGVGAILQPFDQVVIRQLPNWTETEIVTIGGEVRSPGVYTISKEESISQLIQRAGGLTEYADPKASIFLREGLRETEQEMLDEFSRRLSQDLLIRSVRTTSPELQPAQIDSSIMTQLLALVSEAQATGRLVINMPRILQNPNSESDVILRDGDQLLIPRTRQEVSVIGEVQRPTSHLFDASLSVADYIDKSGGFSGNADKKNVFVIKSSGDIVSLSNSRWFFEGGRSVIEPGDSLVVPFDANFTDALYTWSG